MKNTMQPKKKNSQAQNLKKIEMQIMLFKKCTQRKCSIELQLSGATNSNGWLWFGGCASLSLAIFGEKWQAMELEKHKYKFSTAGKRHNVNLGFSSKDYNSWVINQWNVNRDVKGGKMVRGEIHYKKNQNYGEVSYKKIIIIKLPDKIKFF